MGQQLSLRKDFQRLANRKVNNLLWTHFLNISVLEFRVLASVLNIICHISFKHNLHFCDRVVNPAPVNYLPLKSVRNIHLNI